MCSTKNLWFECVPPQKFEHCSQSETWAKLSCNCNSCVIKCMSFILLIHVSGLHFRGMTLIWWRSCMFHSLIDHRDCTIPRRSCSIDSEKIREWYIGLVTVALPPQHTNIESGLNKPSVAKPGIESQLVSVQSVVKQTVIKFANSSWRRSVLNCSFAAVFLEWSDFSATMWFTVESHGNGLNWQLHGLNPAFIWTRKRRRVEVPIARHFDVTFPTFCIYCIRDALQLYVWYVVLCMEIAYSIYMYI